MIKRKKNGQFQKGSKPIAGFQKGTMLGKEHPRWKGGLPKCNVCGIKISWGAKNCRSHSMTDVRKEKIREGAKKRMGAKHWAWKGESAGYRGKHYWITRKLGKPKKCEHCSQDGLVGRKIHWANISGKYLRDISDWLRLCAKCHGEFDKGKRVRNKKLCQSI